MSLLREHTGQELSSRELLCPAVWGGLQPPALPGTPHMGTARCSIPRGSLASPQPPPQSTPVQPSVLESQLCWIPVLWELCCGSLLPQSQCQGAPALQSPSAQSCKHSRVFTPCILCVPSSSCPSFCCSKGPSVLVLFFFFSPKLWF